MKLLICFLDASCPAPAARMKQQLGGSRRVDQTHGGGLEGDGEGV